MFYTGMACGAIVGGMIAVVALCCLTVSREEFAGAVPHIEWFQCRFGELPLGACIRYMDERLNVLCIGIKDSQGAAIVKLPMDHAGTVSLIDPMALVDAQTTKKVVIA